METLRAKQIADYSNLIQLTQGCVLKLLKNLQKLIISGNGSKVDPSISSLSSLSNSVPKNGFISLDKIEQLVTVFSAVFVYDEAYVKRLQAIYFETCNFIQQAFIQSYEAANQALLQGQFDTFVIFAEQLTELQTNYKKHLLPEMEEKYSRLSGEVRSYLFVKVKQINEILPQLNDRLKEVQDFGVKGKHIEDSIVQDDKTVVAEFGNSIAKEITLIYQACSANGLEKYYNNKELRIEIEKIEELIEEYFNSVEQKGFLAIWAANKVTCFSYFYIQLASLDALRQNWQIKEKMQDNYSRIVRQIESNISEINHGAWSQLELFQQLQFSNSVAINYDALKNYVLGLKNATIFLGHTENMYHDELLQITHKLAESINNISLQLSEVRISLDCSYILPKLLILISNLRQIVPIESLLLEQPAKSQILIEKIESNISEVLNTINTLVVENKLMQEIKTFINVFDFFEACQGNLLGGQAIDLNQLWEKVYDYIKNNYSDMSKSLMVAFDMLQASSVIGEDKKESKQGVLSIAKQFGDVVSDSSKKSTPLKHTDQRIEESCQQIIDILLFLSAVRNNYEQFISSTTKQNLPPIALTLRKQIFAELPGAILQDWCAPETGKLIINIKQLIEDANKMELGQYDSAIYIKLTIANKLDPLDKVLFNERTCYALAAAKIESAIKSQRASKESELTLLATKKDLEGFKSLYQSISSTQPELRGSITEILNSFLYNLSDELRQLDDKIRGLVLDSHSLELVRNVMMQLDKLGKIAVVAELGPQHNQKQMEQMLKKTQSTLEEKMMSFINETHGNIDKEQFKLALPRIKFLEAVTKLSENDTSRDRLKTKTINLYTKIKKKVADTNKQFANLEISDYSKKPPINYLKQLEALEVEHALFADFHKELTQIISGKISMAIAECKKEDVDFDVRERLDLIKGLNKYIPLEIYSEHTAEMKVVESAIQIKEEKYRLTYEEMEKADNMIGLVNELIEAKSLHQAKNISDKIIKMMQGAAQRYKCQIESGNLKDIISPLQKSWQGWQYYCFRLESMRSQTTVTEIITDFVLGVFWTKPRTRTEYRYLMDPEIPKKICMDVLSSVSNKCVQIFNSVEPLQTSSVDYNRGFVLIESSFNNLRGLVELYKNYYDNKSSNRYCEHLYASLVSHNSRLSSDNLFKTITYIKDFLSNIQNNFRAILASADLAPLRCVMKTMAKYNHVFIMVKDFVSDEKFKMLLPIGFSAAFAAYIDYSDMRTSLAERLIKLQEVAGQKILENKRAKSSNSFDRKEFYKEIYIAFLGLKTIKPLIEHVHERIADVNSLEFEVHRLISKNLCEVQKQLLELIKLIPCDNNEIYVDLNIWYDNLQLAVECFENSPIARESQLLLNEIDRVFNCKLKAFTEETIYEFKDAQGLLTRLIHLKSMSLYAPAFKEKVDKLVDYVLKSISINISHGANIIATLGIMLNNLRDECQGIAQMLISEHVAFKNYVIQLRNQKTLSHGIDYILSQLDSNKKNTTLNTIELKQCFNSYESLYWNLVETGLLGVEEAKQEIIRNTKIIATEEKPHNKKIIELAAHLCAYWTLMNYETFVIDKEDKIDRNYLLQPHVAQVIAIFRLLGVDVNDSKYLTNHLIEIATGEGKSVIIAVTAMILALQNYDVDCVCYSDYLSKRDNNDFADFFMAFGLQKHIIYGTFGHLCEKFINQYGDVRNLVNNLIIENESSSYNSSASIACKKIVLIDEVDVFFSQDFYGNSYNIMSELKDPTVTELISYIWKNRLDHDAICLTNLKASTVYLACCRRFPTLESFIDRSVQNMLIDVQNFKEPEYFVDNDRICYRNYGHSLDANLYYGYRTIFAYFCEHDNGNITRDARDQHTLLQIYCGKFSYAEVPKQYSYIMGVTGTLNNLSVQKRNLLSEFYSINKFTYMPSIYGKNQLQFAGDSIRDLKIDQTAAHFMEIVNEINIRRMHDKSDKAKVIRPIMVFFESRNKLTEFYCSKELEKSGISEENIKVLTEEIADTQKAGLISLATSSSIVTLLTKGFGRGTDFKCYDERINKQSGGVHIIQTFVSDDPSEEIQIKGRTARQGELGSYSMVLTTDDLKRYNLGETEITLMQSTSSLYSTINEKRCDFFNKKFGEQLTDVNKIKEAHEEAMKFVNALFNKKLQEAADFLSKSNNATFTIKNKKVTEECSAKLMPRPF